jgi:hypothetical protein
LKFEEASRELLKKFFSDAGIGERFTESGPTTESNGEEITDYTHFVHVQRKRKGR